MEEIKLYMRPNQKPVIKKTQKTIGGRSQLTLTVLQTTSGSPPTRG